MDIISILVYLVTCGGLYWVAKKMDYAFPLGAFIPLVNVYMIVQIAGYGKGIVLLLLLFSGITFVDFYIGGILILLLQIFVLYSFGMRTVGNIFVTIGVIIFPVGTFYVIGYMLTQKEKNIKSEKEKMKAKKKIQCSSCDSVFLIPKSIANQDENCPKCKNVIHIT